MNYGKLNEDVYERSVVKVIKANTHTNSTENKEFYNGAEIGNFCAVFPCADTANRSASANGFASAQASASGKNAVMRAYEAALNSIAANGILGSYDWAYADISLFVPEKLREIKVREMLAETARRADELRIPVLNVNVQVLPWVHMETANCVIHMALNGWVERKGASPDDDIVMTKWIGLEGAALIARSSRETLKARYPADIVQETAGFLQYLSVMPEAATAMKSGASDMEAENTAPARLSEEMLEAAELDGASDMQAAGEGGIFGGLWELAAKNSVGLVADLKCIPVRQETIEVCEYFDLNPYELMAGGSLLITCPNGSALVKTLADCGIASAVIGKITQGNDRIIRHEDESRFLEPVRGDEIYKYYNKQMLKGV